MDHRRVHAVVVGRSARGPSEVDGMGRDPSPVSGEFVGCGDAIPAGTRGNIRPLVHDHGERFADRQMRQVLTSQMRHDQVLLGLGQPRPRPALVLRDRVG